MQEVHEMFSRKLCFFIVLSLFLTLFITFSYADWGRWGNGEDGNAICDTTGDQTQPKIISDLVGGAIIVWGDKPSAIEDPDIYAQRINIYGSTQWTSNGVAICTNAAAQGNYRVASDDSGGGIIVWLDHRNNDNNIYVQRVDSTGQAKWTTDGVKIDATAESHQSAKPAIAPDDSGGAIVAWRKDTGNIYAQRINPNGVIQWKDSGVSICDAPNNQDHPEIVRDGNGGAIIAWLDAREDADTTDIYAQRINSSGVVQWDSNGVAIYDSTKAYNLNIVPDNCGGAIITWIDEREGSADFNIWAQRIDASGNTKWTNNGEKVDEIGGHSVRYDATTDSLGGAIIVHHKTNGDNLYDIYATRLDANGNWKWTTNVSPKLQNQENATVCADSAGGAIIAWEDLSLA
jgi:hypothetical protein